MVRGEGLAEKGGGWLGARAAFREEALSQCHKSSLPRSIYYTIPFRYKFTPCASSSHQDVHSSVSEYASLFTGARASVGRISTDASIKTRQANYQKLVTNFYDLVTDFYEYGWGQSFHFGPRWHGESFVESIKRAEYHLCSRLGLKPGMRVLDMGCGVGGPMRNMAIFSGAKIDGITINEYQVNIGNKYNA